MYSLSAVSIQEHQGTNNDEALVQRAQEQPAAFAALYHRYFERIYAYLRTRTTVEDAADLTQQVFLQAFDAFPRYRPQQAPFSAWLFRIARNIAIDFNRRQHHSETLDLVPAALQPLVEDDADTSIVRQEDAAYLRALLGTLKAETRELLALRFTAELTAAEIAVVIGKSEAATKKQLARAIHTLKERRHAIAR